MNKPNDLLSPSIKLLRFIVSPVGSLDDEQANIEWRVQMLEWAEEVLGAAPEGSLSEVELSRVKDYIREESTQILADKINYALEQDGSAIVSLTPPGEVSLGALESLLRGIAASFTQQDDGSVRIEAGSVGGRSACDDCQDERCPGSPSCDKKGLN